MLCASLLFVPADKCVEPLYASVQGHEKGIKRLTQLVLGVVLFGNVGLVGVLVVIRSVARLELGQPRPLGDQLGNRLFAVRVVQHLQQSLRDGFDLGVVLKELVHALSEIPVNQLHKPRPVCLCAGD